MKRAMSDFTGKYKLSQTLKFELVPVGATVQRLEESKLLEQDFKRAEDYPKAKEFLDGKHKEFLQKVLSGITDIDWQPLADMLEQFQKNKDLKKELQKLQGEYRKKIVGKFTDKVYKPDYDALTETTPSKLFKEAIKADPALQTEVRRFEGFGCYFIGYQKNRKNIYSDKEQQTSAAHRAVNENFTKYYSAVKIVQKLGEIPELMEDIRVRTAPLLDGESVQDFLTVRNYNRFLSQKGIDIFNRTVAEINQSLQIHKDQSSKVPFLPTLYKQILSDRDQAFLVKAFADGKELLNALKDFVLRNQEVKIRGEKVDLFASLRRVLASLKDDDDLFIDSSEMGKISSRLTGDWSSFQDSAAAYAKATLRTKAQIENYCKDVFHFRDIQFWGVKQYEGDGSKPLSISSYWRRPQLAELFEREKRLRNEILVLADKDDPNLLREREDDVRIIKNYLDTVQDILHDVKPLAVDDKYGGDLDLKGILMEHYFLLAAIIPLYNQTRNFVLKKNADVPKIKLMFNNPICAGGWPDPQTSSSVIFRNGPNFYLGILSDKAKSCLNNYDSEVKSDWEIMIFRQMADPSRDLPNLLPINGKTVRKTGRRDKVSGVNLILEELRNRHLPTNINRIRKAESYKKTSPVFSKEDLTAYIDFYKERIIEYKSDCTFRFKPSGEYAKWEDFANDLDSQAYQLNFGQISKSFVMQLVEEGKLFLFKIWNKDLKPGVHGRPNKSTLYWKAIFDPDNLADVVFKLNSRAELFLREPVIHELKAHRNGEKMVNRTIAFEQDGQTVRTPIPENVYGEIFQYVNGKKEMAAISSDAKSYLEKRLDWKPGMKFEDTLGRLVVKNVTHEIVKDKRFTERKFFFHVPLEINFKAPDGESVKFNDQVRDYLRNNPGVKIIGIDRGERNLLYLVLMDQNGNILEQKSFNILSQRLYNSVVVNVDYHAKLDQRQKERDAARKSWREIGGIKDLKVGYLSGIVYEISRMMVEHNAVVFLEDLNSGFKRGRTKIEKQVYQKFENALITKLNYLIFKDMEDHRSPGGVLNGYQLTPPQGNISQQSKQCGFIFYVPAWCTSKIDPVTGFVNLFGSKWLQWKNIDHARDFFAKFDSISYLPDEDLFEFAFDYKNFTDQAADTRTRWKVCSIGDRIESFRNQEKLNQWDSRTVQLTEEYKKLFLAYGIDIHGDLKKAIAEQSEKGFWDRLLYLFKLTVQLRNSKSNSTAAEDDYILSPVRGTDGTFFDSRKGLKNLPLDADANGAYNIARKGLLLLRQLNDAADPSKVKFDLQRKQWLNFAQGKNPAGS